MAMILTQLPGMGYARNGLTVAQNDTAEQFSLETGKTYYFNLAPLVMPGKGTLNNNLPDTSLQWVPFTYVGTIDAYSRTESGVTSSGVARSKRSLFVADYTVNRFVS